jgi:hypothetical protein
MLLFILSVRDVYMGRMDLRPMIMKVAKEFEDE